MGTKSQCAPPWGSGGGRQARRLEGWDYRGTDAPRSNDEEMDAGRMGIGLPPLLAGSESGVQSDQSFRKTPITLPTI